MTPTLHVLLEDNHCLAVLKPAGLLTQSANEAIPSLETLARAYLREKYQKEGHVYLGVPHRLDRPVSGVVLFARSTKAARRLAMQFRERQVQKLYWTLVEGSVNPDAGDWEDWLLKVSDEARTEIAVPNAPGAKQAALRYRTLLRLADSTLLEIEPLTGRSHQIRVQTASRGWPVVGDALYGSTQAFGPPAELARDRVIALHGRALTFLHPVRYDPVTVTAPLPEHWPLACRGDSCVSSPSST